MAPNTVAPLAIGPHGFPHPAISSGGAVVAIVLDFASAGPLDPANWDTPAGVAYRRSFFASLESYSLISKRFLVKVSYPQHDPNVEHELVLSHNKGMVHSLVKLLNNFKEVESLVVYYRSPKTEWQQIRTLAPLYAMKFQDWKVHLREGTGEYREMLRESFWERRLRGLWLARWN